jgi:hypothetical protein
LVGSGVAVEPDEPQAASSQGAVAAATPPKSRDRLETSGSWGKGVLLSRKYTGSTPLVRHYSSRVLDLSLSIAIYRTVVRLLSYGCKVVSYG